MIYTRFFTETGEYTASSRSAYIINTVIGGCVKLNNIKHRALLDAETAFAPVAGVAVFRMLAVDRARKYLRAGGFARAASADKKVGMAQAVIDYLIFESLCDLLLPCNIVEGARTPLSV